MEFYSKVNFKLFYPKGNSLTILSFSNISILKLTLIIFPYDDQLPSINNDQHNDKTIRREKRVVYNQIIGHV
jgi:hypothetical protein